jgi:proline iminopeptidase
MAASFPMRTRYPAIEPNQTGFIPVTHQHKIYWEESGNPQGKPVVFLHGGPGSGTEPSHRCFFDPAAYRIILFDQRGCGKSTPHACLEENTTWDLVADMEKIRTLLKIDQWVIFGGSWGSTLALAYAETHPDRVLGLILRGIFLGTEAELHWFYQAGAHFIYPDAYEKYIAPIPEKERGQLMKAYHKRLTSSDPEVRKKYAHTWSAWEAAALRLIFDPSLFSQFTEEHRADAIARIECHYFLNRCFFKTDQWLLEHISAIRHIPAKIIHGRYDIVCPFHSAWQLHKAWPEAHLQIIPDAGHAASEPGITDALIRATDSFR